ATPAMATNRTTTSAAYRRMRPPPPSRLVGWTVGPRDPARESAGDRWSGGTSNVLGGAQERDYERRLAVLVHCSRSSSRNARVSPIDRGPSAPLRPGS